MPYAAVAFDLFETLVSEYDLLFPSKEEVAAALGVEVERFTREYRRIQQDRYTGELDDYESVLRCIAERLGAQPNGERVSDLLRRRLDGFADCLRDVEPAILSAVSDLREMGLSICIISNTEGSEVGSFPTSPLSPLVDATVFSHEVGMTKPDPRIYELACQRLGVEPEACVYVGDGGSDELRGAAGVGMTPVCCVWFLRRHTAILGDDAIAKRAQGFPMVAEVVELLEFVKEE